MRKEPSARSISEWLDGAAASFPERIAVEDWNGVTITYRALADCARRLSVTLRKDYKIQRGDRIGILMRKSVDTLIAFHAVLRTGAAYVPIDPLGPIRRAAMLLSDCKAKAVVVDEDLVETLRCELENLSASISLLSVQCQARSQGSWRMDEVAGLAADADAMESDTDDIAFILYTSGSTGVPKGAMLTHGNVVDFIDWCSDTFAPSERDRFATHSPLHFSLPVFNLYVACKHGSAVCLLDERTAKIPQVLAPLIAKLRITVWFSTPVVLSLLMQCSALRHVDTSALRLVMWGGEAMRTDTLQALRAQLPHCRHVNVLGSTETHIIAHYEIPHDALQEELCAVPVGTVGARFLSAIDPDESTGTDSFTEGELWVSGPGVTIGYWNDPDSTARLFFTDERGQRWLRTGDIVRVRQDGQLICRGRRDRRVKKHGNRIELGEIEACLWARQGLREVAVVAVSDPELGIKVQAFVVAEPPRPSIIELKAHCAKSLPGYMVPDIFTVADDLPRTSTGKVDYQRLKEMV